jgi:hypothetical protein
MVFLDVEKAFESVWHDGLLHKLVIFICYLYLTKIIASFCSGRSFHVSVNQTDSATHPIPYDVAQGAILSPSLYNFFTDESPQINESETATFADDTAIFVSILFPRNSISGRSKFTAKAQAIYFRRCWSPRKLPTAHIRVGGHPIPWSTKVKYLGVTLDKRLTFAGHTAKSIEKSEKAFRILYSFFKRKSKFNVCIINYYITKRAFARFYLMGLKPGTTVPVKI